MAREVPVVSAWLLTDGLLFSGIQCLPIVRRTVGGWVESADWNDPVVGIWLLLLVLRGVASVVDQFHRNRDVRAFRRELRLTPAAAADLMSTPLGPGDFAAGQREWIARALAWKAAVWCGSLLVHLIVVCVSSRVVFSFPLVFSAYFAAKCSVEARGWTVSAARVGCSRLRKMRAGILRESPRSLQGDPASDDWMSVSLGWWTPIYTVLLAWIANLLLLPLGVSDNSLPVLLYLSSFVVGSVRGVLILQTRRNALRMNLHASEVHMRFILNCLREEMAAERPLP